MKDVSILPDERLDAVNEKITLIQKKDGLTFGTDAYLLAAFMKAQKNAYAVELGTGTGIISILCAARGRFAHIDALEIQESFYTLADRNIALNALDDTVTAHHLDVREASPATLGREADVVFTNPPYMSIDGGARNASDRKYIARHEVCGDIGDFCAAAYRLLKHGGRFYCVYRPDRLSSLMAAMRENRLEPKVCCFVHSDESSEPSMVLISATKGGAEGLRIMPPLLMHEPKTDGVQARDMTDRAKKIYETMSFWE